MPYFKWRGINLQAQMKYGMSWARDSQELQRLLLRHEIALLHARVHKQWIIRPVTLALKASLFNRLTALLKSGILLPEALDLVASYMGHAHFQDALAAIAQRVRSGHQLDGAFQAYGRFFDSFTISLLQVGYQAGYLSDVTQLLAVYLEQRHGFYKQARAAALMPFCILIFFIAVCLVIFVAIIPQFQVIFNASDSHIPRLTSYLLTISKVLQSWYTPFVAGLFLLSGYLLYKSAVQTRWVQVAIDRVVLQVPIIGALYRQQATATFFYLLFIVLKSGVQLVTALEMAGDSLSNSVLRTYAREIAHEVRTGLSLSDALSRYQGIWFDQEVIALIAVGQESDSVPEMVYSIATTYQERIKTELTRLTTFIQPVLMVFIGLLVAVLLVAVYIPIFEMAHVIR